MEVLKSVSLRLKTSMLIYYSIGGLLHARWNCSQSSGCSHHRHRKPEIQRHLSACTFASAGNQTWSLGHCNTYSCSGECPVPKVWSLLIFVHCLFLQTGHFLSPSVKGSWSSSVFGFSTEVGFLPCGEGAVGRTFGNKTGLKLCGDCCSSWIPTNPWGLMG